jgi:branched-chain amino acid transport system permease protein
MGELQDNFPGAELEPARPEVGGPAVPFRLSRRARESAAEAVMTNIQILLEQPAFALQLLIDGVLTGAVFALAAYGMALVWGVMNVINVAQGEFVILGGYAALYTYQAGVSPFFGIPTAAIVMFAVGWVVYWVVVSRVVDKDLFTSLLATFGVSILFAQLANQLFGVDMQSIDPGLGTLNLFDNKITVSLIKVVSFCLALVIGALLVLFLSRARLGQAIRATAQNARAARLMGIDTDRIYAMTFSINAAICGAAGALVVMTWVIHPYIGLTYTIRSFMIVVVAGLGNLATVIVAALGLGVVENFAGFILGAQAQLAFVFSLLVVILVGRNLQMRRQRKVLR